MHISATPRQNIARIKNNLTVTKGLCTTTATDKQGILKRPTALSQQGTARVVGANCNDMATLAVLYAGPVIIDDGILLYLIYN